jgi:hypoxanthine-DNA glycosylase
MIIHPIPPLFDENSKTLILGSFPSVKSRESAFFYGYKQNRFWQVVASVLGEKTPNSIEEKKKLILGNNLALWDVIGKCEIEGSADSTIKNVTANDLTIILNNAPIDRIFVNGKTALKYYDKFILPSINRPAILLPSTSPANAVYTLEKLISEWKIIKN